jgi:hypothetical protein
MGQQEHHTSAARGRRCRRADGARQRRENRRPQNAIAALLECGDSSPLSPHQDRCILTRPHCQRGNELPHSIGGPGMWTTEDRP